MIKTRVDEEGKRWEANIERKSLLVVLSVCRDNNGKF